MWSSPLTIHKQVKLMTIFLNPVLVLYDTLYSWHIKNAVFAYILQKALTFTGLLYL